MGPDIQNAFVFAHQANIERYRKILETYLTTDERHFVESRLAEEQAALKRLAGPLSQPASPSLRS
jgi:hypothetical protein